MKVIFLGTPDFAVASLEALIESSHEVIAVVSQPDRARDRKGNLLPTPVKKAAIDKGLKVYQFEKIKTEGLNVLKELGADIMVTAAYGQILSKEIIDVAPFGIVNVHASLLPKYRGSAPIQWAVINGEKETGITIMQTDVGVDSGDILAVAKTAIGENETSGELFDRLKVLGAELLIKTLDALERGKIKPVSQDESKASKCRMLVKEDGKIDFSKTKEQIINLVRGVTPFIGAYAVCDGINIKIGRVSPVEGDFGNCGTIRADKKEIIAACADGGIRIELLQLPNKKMLAASQFLAGYRFKDGARFQ